MARNYKKEYDNYHSTEKQKKRRASRNTARAIMAKRGLVTKGDGKDVHHTTGNPLNNDKKKLSVKAKSKNRSFARTKTAGKKNPRA
jgi:hypothetical protein|tara:strand:- start:1998 stop:2255 length:258 start_codon:yes stop_codon:yes gene_type:complete